MQVDQLPRFVAAGIREVLQVTHDAGDTLDAFARFRHQLRQVAADEIDVQAVTDVIDFRNQCLRVRRAQGTLVSFDHGEQAAQVFLQAAQIGVHVTDRVVDFVRDAGGQLADRGHLLGLQQLFLGAIEAQVGLAQLGVALLQFALVVFLPFDVAEQREKMPFADRTMVVQVGDDHALAQRQAAIPVAVLAGLFQCIGGSSSRSRCGGGNPPSSPLASRFCAAGLARATCPSSVNSSRPSRRRSSRACSTGCGGRGR